MDGFDGGVNSYGEETRQGGSIVSAGLAVAPDGRLISRSFVVDGSPIVIQMYGVATAELFVINPYTGLSAPYKQFNNGVTLSNTGNTVATLGTPGAYLFHITTADIAQVDINVFRSKLPIAPRR